jgi:hypothetical protein
MSTSIDQGGVPPSGDVFDRGIEAGQFPLPEIQEGSETDTITTGKSRWLGTRCETCNQTFRPGDRVQVWADRTVSHLDPALECRREEAAPADDDSDETADEAPAPGSGLTEAAEVAADDNDMFVAGLDRAWPPANDVPVFRLTRQNWQITTPKSGSTSPVCLGCGHTFRAGDMVIICPCADAGDDPRRGFCQLAVHRDPARGLCCWDDWAPTGELHRCPRTFDVVNR